MKTAIMGTGGLGGYFGAKLAYVGMDVVFIARGELLRTIRQNGLQVRSPKGDFAVNAIQATDDTTQVGVVDLILVCVKSYDLDNALPALLPLIDSHTAVLALLNGIEHIAKMQAVLGAKHVLGGISMTYARKGEPGMVHHFADLGQYQIESGEWEGTISPRLEKGNRLEVEATNGFIARLGQELNIATPANDFIYACLKPHMGAAL